jgi:phage shock protein A
MVKSKDEQIFIGNDNEVIELTGADKEAFIADREALANKVAIQKAEAEAKVAQKQAILDRIGLTADELKTILG